MRLKHHAVAVLTLVLLTIGCQGGQLAPSPSRETSLTRQPPASAQAKSTLAPSASADILTGTIAFDRVDGAGEHYFTIRPDGSNEHDLFSIQGCSCIQLSPDGSTIWTLAETEHGTVAFTTMRPDGTDRTVHLPPTKTLSLVAGPEASTPDGRLIAFYGWDDTRPGSAGVYLASPDLSGLHQVTPLPEGVIAVAPYGVTPDGSRVLFYGETGSIGPVTHTGDLFVIDADGKNLRQLNPEGLSLAEVRGLPASLSPDGARAAFAAFEGDPARSAVYVVSLDGGPAARVTDVTSGIWSAAWAPVGERITFAAWSNDKAVVSVVNADGTERRDLSDPAEDVGFGAWSPDGSHLLVSRGPESARDLWILDLEGTFIAQVTHQPAKYDVYRWAPEFTP